MEEFTEVAALVTQQAQSQPELYMTLKVETSQLWGKFWNQSILPGIPRRPPGTDNWGACAKFESMDRADVGIPRWRLLWGCGACNKGTIDEPYHYISSSRRQKHRSKREQSHLMQKYSPQEKAGLGRSSSPAEVYDVSWWSPVYWHWIQLELW